MQKINYYITGIMKDTIKINLVNLYYKQVDFKMPSKDEKYKEKYLKIIKKW